MLNPVPSFNTDFIDFLKKPSVIEALLGIFVVRSTDLGGGDDRFGDWEIMEAAADWPGLPWPSEQVSLPLDGTAWVGARRL